MSRRNRNRPYRNPQAEPQLTVVADEQAEPQPEVKTIEMRLKVKHMPAFNRWRRDDSEENLVALFEAMYPGAGELDAPEYDSLLAAFSAAMDVYTEQRMSRMTPAERRATEERLAAARKARANGNG